MEPIIINIATIEPYDKRVYRFLVIGLTLMMVGISAFNIYFFLKNRLIQMEYQEKIANLERVATEEKRANSLHGGPMNDAQRAGIEKEISLINTLIYQDRFPWPAILDLIEISMPEDVILIRIVNTPDSKTVTLEGYARTPEKVAAFMDGLKSQGSFWEARLLSLNVDPLKNEQAVQESLIKFDVSLTLDLEQLVLLGEKAAR